MKMRREIARRRRLINRVALAVVDQHAAGVNEGFHASLCSRHQCHRTIDNRRSQTPIGLEKGSGRQMEDRIDPLSVPMQAGWRRQVGADELGSKGSKQGSARVTADHQARRKIIGIEDASPVRNR